MLDVAFTLFATPVSWLELLAFLLALACVALCVVESHWNWPLAIVSSVMYAIVFEASGLYGEAGLQFVFVALSAWGWWQWLAGRRRLVAPDGTPVPDAPVVPLRVVRLGRRWPLAAAAWGLLWPAIGLLLAHTTDSDVPYVDALATSGSVVAQAMMGRKLVENWPIWVLVDVFSVGLFAYKGLLLTSLLYAIFGGLALAGWWRWHRLAGNVLPGAGPLAAAAAATADRPAA